ncbi:MAG TPA: ATP-binding protein [Blastocatellia bacterium]|nr:ATP-binding protein [Blastocatellia bacterium]
MSHSPSEKLLSRLADDQFFGRSAELDRLYAIAHARPDAADYRNALQPAAISIIVGAPRVGKTEILLRTFDRMFSEAAQVVPVYSCFRSYYLDADRLARELLSDFLRQFIAFRRRDPGLLAAPGGSLASISRGALPEDHLWLRQVVDSFEAAATAGDVRAMVRCAVSAPAVSASSTGLRPFVMLDNFHVIAGAGVRSEVLPELLHTLLAGRVESAASHVLCGLRRPILDRMPAEEEVFSRIEFLHVDPLTDEPLEQMIVSIARGRAVEMSGSTAELMVQQLNRDLFYIRALVDAASSGGHSLRTFMEFERVYTDEVLRGRIGGYFDALLRELAPEWAWRRAVLDSLLRSVQGGDALPIEALLEPLRDQGRGAEDLLNRLHARELIEINYGLVKPSPDPVFADYVRSKHRTAVAGLPRPVVGDHLLGDRLRQAYRLMTSRHTRAVEAELVEVLSRFDFQPAPALLVDEPAFERKYRGSSRVQIRRLLAEEQERIRLPQIASVDDVGSAAEEGISWRLFAASGFDGGVYSEANEVLWLVALVRSKEPLDLGTLNRIDQQLESGAARSRRWSGPIPRVVRWFISNEGFSGVASERLAANQAYRSNYLQLDLLHDYLINLAEGPAGRRPASEFELVIPIQDEAELIAARTVEQIARAADFDQEAINQIKTALIEACINAAEHSDSPDRKIHQRFAIDDDRLIITVSNKGRTFGSSNGATAPAAARATKGSRGRGLKIIGSLMDEVSFERTDDGTSLVMTKLLKRPEQQ